MKAVKSRSLTVKYTIGHQEVQSGIEPIATANGLRIISRHPVNNGETMTEYITVQGSRDNYDKCQDDIRAMKSSLGYPVPARIMRM